jgi:hypothetical protein
VSDCTGGFALLAPDTALRVDKNSLHTITPFLQGANDTSSLSDAYLHGIVMKILYESIFASLLLRRDSREPEGKFLVLLMKVLALKMYHRRLTKNASTDSSDEVRPSGVFSI